MVHDIEAAMDQDLDTLDWMSAATKVKAKENCTPSPTRLAIPTIGVIIPSSASCAATPSATHNAPVEFENRRQLAKIDSPWIAAMGHQPRDRRCLLQPQHERHQFPAGILQSPFFDPKATDAENYGHVGGIVGHELTHGFDDEGRQFGANGNLSDWWTPEDAKKFEEKADCEVKEYGSFVAVDDVKVNGKLTLGENTADNGGLRLAYIAFLADAKRKSIDLTAKQDGYTPLQQFFLGHGQTWCGSTRPEQLRLQVQTDPHSPGNSESTGVVQKHDRIRPGLRLQNWPAHDAGQRLPCLVRCGEGQTLWPDHALRANGRISVVITDT